ncbi:MAG: hypothetical protein WBF89_04310, partial [Steroidobacteraceae bacterium]
RGTVPAHRLGGSDCGAAGAQDVGQGGRGWLTVTDWRFAVTGWRLTVTSACGDLSFPERRAGPEGAVLVCRRGMGLSLGLGRIQASASLDQNHHLHLALLRLAVAVFHSTP